MKRDKIDCQSRTNSLDRVRKPSAAKNHGANVGCTAWVSGPNSISMGSKQRRKEKLPPLEREMKGSSKTDDQHTLTILKREKEEERMIETDKERKRKRESLEG